MGRTAALYAVVGPVLPESIAGGVVEAWRTRTFRSSPLTTRLHQVQRQCASHSVLTQCK